MNRKQKKETEKRMKTESKKYPDTLAEILKENWPPWPFKNDPPVKALRSKKFMVQVFKEGVNIRLSVSKAKVERFENSRPIWEENISWEELQELKNQAGYGEMLAVEIYPKNENIVNVANMRHLWIIENLDIGWKK